MRLQRINLQIFAIDSKKEAKFKNQSFISIHGLSEEIIINHLSLMMTDYLWSFKKDP